MPAGLTEPCRDVAGKTLSIGRRIARSDYRASGLLQQINPAGNKQDRWRVGGLSQKLRKGRVTVHEDLATQSLYPFEIARRVLTRIKFDPAAPGYACCKFRQCRQSLLRRTVYLQQLMIGGGSDIVTLSQLQPGQPLFIRQA